MRIILQGLIKIKHCYIFNNVQKGDFDVMLDKWIGMSYYKFPSFDLSFERVAYESWNEFYNEDELYVDYIQDEGEDECWD